MTQVLLRSAFLLRRPGIIAIGILLAVGGSALVSIPIFGVPGYELATALTLGVGLLGGGVGASAAFLERRIIQGRDPRPTRALRSDSAFVSSFRAIAAAFALNSVFLLPPIVTSIVHAVASTRCDPLAQIVFVPLLVIPSALLASACGALCGFWAEHVWSAALLYVGFVVASAIATAWPLLYGPQAFAFNHFGGYLPGPIYDEALEIRPSLLWFRLLTVLLALAAWGVVAWSLSMRDGQLTWPHLRPGSAALLVFLGVPIIALEQRAPQLGFRMNDATVAERLGGTRETEHFILHYPREKPREDVERWVRDLEFRQTQIAAFLGGAPTERIRVWIYRSAEEKQALVGAAHTQFAKPWRLEIHVNDAPFPHPAIKHELVHAMAAPFASGPFHTTTRFGVWPLMGIIEGLAVAGDNPVDELTLHEWAAGMRREQLAPDVRSVLGPNGFYAAAGQRAYTVVGSFLRYLADQYGPQKLTALYAHGDFNATYGRPLDDLALEWERYLSVLPLDETAIGQAFARFHQKSIFARACAREVAVDSELASTLLESDPAQSLELFQRCAALQPEEPAFALGQAAALVRVGRRGDARSLLRELEAKVPGQPALLAELAMAQSDLSIAMGKKDDARAELTHALSLKPAAAIDRTARVKLAAIDTPSEAAIADYFRPGQDDVKLLLLEQALEHDPKNASVAYLLGRRLVGPAPRIALRYLEQALALDLPDSIRREALRLQLQASYLAGDCQAVRQIVGALPDYGAPFKAQATEWLERCAFEDKAFHGPLVPEDGFK